MSTEVEPFSLDTLQKISQMFLALLVLVLVLAWPAFRSNATFAQEDSNTLVTSLSRTPVTIYSGDTVILRIASAESGATILWAMAASDHYGSKVRRLSCLGPRCRVSFAHVKMGRKYVRCAVIGQHRTAFVQFTIDVVPSPSQKLEVRDVDVDVKSPSSKDVAEADFKVDPKWLFDASHFREGVEHYAAQEDIRARIAMIWAKWNEPPRAAFAKKVLKRIQKRRYFFLLQDSAMSIDSNFARQSSAGDSSQNVEDQTDAAASNTTSPKPPMRLMLLELTHQGRLRALRTEESVLDIGVSDSRGFTTDPLEWLGINEIDDGSTSNKTGSVEEREEKKQKRYRTSDWIDTATFAFVEWTYTDRASDGRSLWHVALRPHGGQRTFGKSAAVSVLGVDSKVGFHEVGIQPVLGASIEFGRDRNPNRPSILHPLTLQMGDAADYSYTRQSLSAMVSPIATGRTDLQGELQWQALKHPSHEAKALDQLEQGFALTLRQRLGDRHQFSAHLRLAEVSYSERPQADIVHVRQGGVRWSWYALPIFFRDVVFNFEQGQSTEPTSSYSRMMVRIEGHLDL